LFKIESARALLYIEGKSKSEGWDVLAAEERGVIDFITEELVKDVYSVVEVDGFCLQYCRELIPTLKKERNMGIFKLEDNIDLPREPYFLVYLYF
jgi:hypothetical protein